MSIDIAQLQILALMQVQAVEVSQLQVLALTQAQAIEMSQLQILALSDASLAPEGPPVEPPVISGTPVSITTSNAPTPPIESPSASRFMVNFEVHSTRAPWGGESADADIVLIGEDVTASTFTMSIGPNGELPTAILSSADTGVEGVSVSYDANYIHPVRRAIEGASTIRPQIDEATLQSLTADNGEAIELHYELLETPLAGLKRVICYGTLTLPPNPGDVVIPPPDPTAWAFPVVADFQGSSYTVGGAPVTVADLFYEDLAWASFDPGTMIDPTDGLVSASGGGPRFTQELFDLLIADGFTGIFEFEQADFVSSGVLFDVTNDDASNYVFYELAFNGDGNDYISDSVALYDNVPNVGTGTRKVAVTMDGTHIAISTNGGTVVSGTSATFADLSKAVLQVSGTTHLWNMTFQAAAADVDLPALSTP